MFIRKNKTNKDLTDKVWLQQEALRRMPEHLLQLALVIDDQAPPSDRPWAFWSTPPIKDFNLSDYFNEAKEEEDD